MKPTTFIVIFSCLSALVAVSTPSYARTTGWILKINHVEVGELTIYITESALKISFDQKGWCLVASAPTNKVYVFRPREKTMWVGVPEQFSPATLFNPFKPPCPSRRFQPVVLKPGEHYKNDRIHQVVELKGSGKQAAMNYTEYSTVTPSLRHLVFRTTKDIDAGPIVTDTLSRLFEVPDLHAVPIYVRSNAQGNQTYISERERSRDMMPIRVNTPDLRVGPVVVVETAKAQRRDVDTSIFEVPKGFRKVKDIVDVTYSKDEKAELQDMLINIGFSQGKTGHAKDVPAASKKESPREK